MMMTEYMASVIEARVLEALVEDNELDERTLDKLPLDVVELFGALEGEGVKLYRAAISKGGQGGGGGGGFGSLSDHDQKRFRAALEKAAKGMELDAREQKQIVDYAIRSITQRATSTRAPHYVGDREPMAASSDAVSANLGEVSPPGFEGTVLAMKKKHKDIENPWALAWWMKGKGDESHYKVKGDKPVRKKEEAKGDCGCGGEPEDCGCDDCEKSRAKKTKSEGLSGDLSSAMGESSRSGQWFVIIDKKTGKAVGNDIFTGSKTADAALDKMGGEKKTGYQVMDAAFHNPSRAKLKAMGWVGEGRESAVSVDAHADPGDAGYEPAYALPPDKPGETTVNVNAAVAAIIDDVVRDNKTAKPETVDPLGVAKVLKPTQYTAEEKFTSVYDAVPGRESIHDIAPDERVSMAEAYDKMLSGGDLDEAGREAAELYERLVINESVAKKVSAESADDAFEVALVMEGALTEEQNGHHFFDGKSYFVDTAFLGHTWQPDAIIKGMELKHMGMGEFELSGPAGRIDFDRMRGKDFPGMSGRSHKVYDDKGGKLVKELIAAMEKKKRSELVKESLDEGGLDPQGSGENKIGDTDVMPAKDGKFNVFQRKADGWKKVAGPFDSAEQARSAAAKVEKGKAESLGDALASGIGELDEAAKLKGKKLDAEINRLFKQHGNNIQFHIMDLGKIHKAGADAAASGEDIEAAVVAAINKYKLSEGGGKKFSGWATNLKSGKKLPVHTVTARDEDDAVKQAKGIIAKSGGKPDDFSYEMKPLRAVKEDSLDGDGANLTEATNGKVGTFLTILSSHLTQYDKKQIAGETKRGGRGNIHRLSLLLGALGKVRDDVKDVEGSDSSEAMEKLKWSLSKRFNDGFPPVTKLVKQIDAFVSSGKLPKITVQKSNEDIDLDEATEMAKPSFHAGSRVKFSPAAMRASMYREYHPKKGEMGTVVSNEYGRWPSDNPKKGSGAVKVKWDKAGLQTVHPEDAEITGGKSAKAEDSGFAGALGHALL